MARDGSAHGKVSTEIQQVSHREQRKKDSMPAVRYSLRFNVWVSHPRT